MCIHTLNHRINSNKTGRTTTTRSAKNHPPHFYGKIAWNTCNVYHAEPLPHRAVNYPGLKTTPIKRLNSLPSREYVPIGFDVVRNYYNRSSHDLLLMFKLGDFGWRVNLILCGICALEETVSSNKIL